jgi:hypothetical protein
MLFHPAKHRSLTALVADSTRQILPSEAVQAVGGIRGIEEGSFSIVPFFPENFIIHCRSQDTRDRILGSGTVPVAGTFLPGHLAANCAPR